MALIREQITIIQQSFTDTLAQQQAILKAQHQQLIKAIYKELYNTKALILKTPVLIPSADKIEINILKYDPLNANPKLAIVI